MALRSRRSKFTLVISVLFLLILFSIVHSLSGQSVGSVNNDPATNIAKEDSEAEVKPLTYTGKYLSFKYPNDYKIVGSQLSGSYVEVVSLYSTNNNENSISIGVEPETLSEDTGISFRKMNPSTYKLIASSANTIEFEGNTSSGYEEDYFVQHGTYVADIVLTSLTQANAGSDINKIIDSLKWSN